MHIDLHHRIRAAVRALMAPVASTRSPVATEPYYLKSVRAPSRFQPDARPGTFVFFIEVAPKGGGGLSDILHLGQELEKLYKVQVSYRVTGPQVYEEAVEAILWTDPSVRRDQIIEELSFIPEFLCATAWPTAYQVRATPSARKVYFVQDDEPRFFKAGLKQYYAEASYGLGLRIFTLGPWLARDLGQRHGLEDVVAMPCPCSDNPMLGRSWSDRDTVAVYIQPDKEQRGSELLVEALRRIRAETSLRDLRVVVFGSRANDFLLPDVDCDWRGLLDQSEMVDLLSRTRVGVCASFTNISLLTYRFLAHGCVAVDLDLPNVGENLPPPLRRLTELVEPMPEAVAGAILKWARQEPSHASRVDGMETLAHAHTWTACAQSLAPLFA